MGAASSVPGEYLVSPKVSRRKVKRICELKGVLWTGLRDIPSPIDPLDLSANPAATPQNPVKNQLINIRPKPKPAASAGRGQQPITRTGGHDSRQKSPGAKLLFDSLCDRRGNISRMQLLWATNNFSPDGTLVPIGQFK